MQSRTLLSILGGTLLFTLNGPLQVSAQAQDKSQPRYRLIDLALSAGPTAIRVPAIHRHIYSMATARLSARQIRRSPIPSHQTV
jgi:hypothetical protein